MVLTFKAESLLQDMLDNILRQQTLASVSRYRSLKSTLGENEKESVFIDDIMSSSKDIYGQDKQKLKVSETSKYFQCENCGRSIAGEGLPNI